MNNTISLNRTPLSWDQYFMTIAVASSYRSKDPHTQVGACIVNKRNRITSIGYNGMPTGCDDSKMPWDRENTDPTKTKYPYVCHAELNAILNNEGKDIIGSRLYVTLFPCNECVKAIIQAGIKEIIYLDDKYDGTDSNKEAKFMLNMVGITTRKLYMKINIDIQ